MDGRDVPLILSAHIVTNMALPVSVFNEELLTLNEVGLWTVVTQLKIGRLIALDACFELCGVLELC